MRIDREVGAVSLNKASADSVEARLRFTQGKFTKRVPGPDGLRAVSILLVLCGHLDGTHGVYSSSRFGGVSATSPSATGRLVSLCHYAIEKPFLRLRDARRPRSIPIHAPPNLISFGHE
jgi:hypothetical protein